MKNQSRARRRAHRNRLINKCMSYNVMSWWTTYPANIEPVRKQAARIINTRARCSCDMCGNPRRSIWLNKEERLTMPERKENLRYACDILYVDINNELIDNDDI